MNPQSVIKYHWIIRTLQQAKDNDTQIDAKTIEAVFNIPLKDASLILTNFYKGTY